MTKQNASQTKDGRARIDFIDIYGSLCAIKPSNCTSEPAIQFVVYQEPVKAGEDPLPMHLNRALVSEMLPLLQHFVETGELPTEPKILLS